MDFARATDHVERQFDRAVLEGFRQERQQLLAALNDLSTGSLSTRYVGRPGALVEAWDQLTVDQQRHSSPTRSGTWSSVRCASATRGFDPTLSWSKPWGRSTK